MTNIKLMIYYLVQLKYMTGFQKKMLIYLTHGNIILISFAPYPIKLIKFQIASSDLLYYVKCQQKQEFK